MRPSAVVLGVDTTTPSGELAANVMASVAQWERRAIGQRTREALAAKRAQGVQLGRRRTLDDAIRRRVHALRRDGTSYARIAAALNAQGVPTAQGGREWYAATVRKIALSV